MIIRILCFLFSLLLLQSCNTENKTTAPFTASQKDSLAIVMGAHLFFDKRLSYNETMACASCHLPEKAFTDGKPKSIGIHGFTTDRNSPMLLNLVDHPYFMRDGAIATLEIQALAPIRDTIELANSDLQALIDRLSNDEDYRVWSQLIYGRDFDIFVLTRTLGSFQRVMESKNAAFDQWYYNGDEKAVSEEVKRGFNLFAKELNCIQCHALPHFSDFSMRNNGLYAHYQDPGRFRVSKDSADMGKFKVPSLRNVSLTAPYMHDGSLATLSDVILHYQNGGASHFLKDSLLQPFTINEKELAALTAFFDALVDTSYMEQLKSIKNYRKFK